MSSTNHVTLGEALRALPLAAPPGDEWTLLRERLRCERLPPAPPRAAWRRYALPAALAAALAGAFVILRVPKTSVPATVAHVAASSSSNGTQAAQIHNAQNAANPGARLAQLQQRSQALERWLRQTGRDAAPLQGQDLAAAAEIENLIGLVDVELAAPRQTRAPALWQRRVGLLEDLAALRYSNYRLAAGGQLAASWQID
ncbi:MAG TPA: hypothetical protein VIC31_03530 [Rudaea sp.]|jgi:hypothetical protein